MKDWKTTTYQDIEVGDVVDNGKTKMGRVRSVRVVAEQGPQLGQVELYVETVGPMVAPHETEIDVYR